VYNEQTNKNCTVMKQICD